MRGTQDDNELSFITLAASTANVVRYLQPNEKQNEDTGGDTDSGRADEKKGAADEEYVERRLRELAAFERKVSGK